MTRETGHIELERTIDSIRVGQRHRNDLGELDALAESIDRHGLLQPLTITPDGVLVCGARRYAALKKLGWTSVNVWVRSGISDRLGLLLAEQDDNVLHKPLSPIEAAALYRELKELLAEDAARRQQATRFSTDRQPGTDGAGNLPAPSEAAGRASEQAASMIPDAPSYRTLDKITELQRLAGDPAQPAQVRREAEIALDAIENGHAVHPAHQAVQSLLQSVETGRDIELHQLATEALRRAKSEKKTRKHPRRHADNNQEPAQYPVRAFILTWNDLANWWTHYDPKTLAEELTDEQIAVFFDTVEGTVRFARRLRAAKGLPQEESGQLRTTQLRVV